jgi:hypothetical protein
VFFSIVTFLAFLAQWRCVTARTHGRNRRTDPRIGRAVKRGGSARRFNLAV